MWTWCAVGFAVLVLATALATIGLLDVNRDAYHDWVNFDAQGNEQQYEELRTSAAMMYTSGHAVGQLGAALFGVLLAATAARRANRWTVALAITGGAILALVSLALALPRARAAVGELWMIDELTGRGFVFDQNLLAGWRRRGVPGGRTHRLSTMDNRGTGREPPVASGRGGDRRAGVVPGVDRGRFPLRRGGQRGPAAVQQPGPGAAHTAIPLGGRHRDARTGRVGRGVLSHRARRQATYSSADPSEGRPPQAAA